MASRSFKSLESTSISDVDFIHSGHYEIENNKIKQKFKLQKVIHSEIKILNKSLMIKDGDLVLENFNNLSGIINSNSIKLISSINFPIKNLIGIHWSEPEENLIKYGDFNLNFLKVFFPLQN